jgi:hypothetical protein
MSANITSSILSGCTAGSILNFRITQPSSGGPYTITWPTGFSQACQISGIANSSTNFSGWWDGTNIQYISCSVDTGPSIAAEQAAPSGNPASGIEWFWFDSTGLFPRSKNNAGTIFQMSKELTAANVRCAGGANTVDASCTGAQIAAALGANYMRRVCDIAVGDTSGSALVNGQLGPQKRICYIPAASTIVEVDVAADGGTPNVIIAKNVAGTVTNILSSALATAATGGIACSNTGGTTGIDGATTCSATLQNTAIAAGSYLELVSGTAGGTAKFMTMHVIYTEN